MSEKIEKNEREVAVEVLNKTKDMLKAFLAKKEVCSIEKKDQDLCEKEDKKVEDKEESTEVSLSHKKTAKLKDFLKKIESKRSAKQG